MPYIVGQTPLRDHEQAFTPEAAIRALAGKEDIQVPEKAYYFERQADAIAYAHDLQKQHAEQSKGLVVFETGDIPRAHREQVQPIKLSTPLTIEKRSRSELPGRLTTLSKIKLVNASLLDASGSTLEQTVDISQMNISEIMAQHQASAEKSVEVMQGASNVTEAPKEHVQNNSATSMLAELAKAREARQKAKQPAQAIASKTDEEAVQEEVSAVEQAPQQKSAVNTLLSQAAKLRSTRAKFLQESDKLFEEFVAANPTLSATDKEKFKAQFVAQRSKQAARLQASDERAEEFKAELANNIAAFETQLQTTVESALMPEHISESTTNVQNDNEDGMVEDVPEDSEEWGAAVGASAKKSTSSSESSASTSESGAPIDIASEATEKEEILAEFEEYKAEHLRNKGARLKERYPEVSPEEIDRLSDEVMEKTSELTERLSRSDLSVEAYKVEVKQVMSNLKETLDTLKATTPASAKSTSNRTATASEQLKSTAGRRSKGKDEIEAPLQKSAKQESTAKRVFVTYAIPVLAVASIALSLHFTGIYSVSSLAQAAVLTTMSAGLVAIKRFVAKKIRAYKGNGANAAGKTNGKQSDSSAAKAGGNAPASKKEAEASPQLGAPKGMLNAFDKSKVPANTQKASNNIVQGPDTDQDARKKPAVN